MNSNIITEYTYTDYWWKSTNEIQNNDHDNIQNDQLHAHTNITLLQIDATTIDKAIDEFEKWYYEVIKFLKRSEKGKSLNSNEKMN